MLTSTATGLSLATSRDLDSAAAAATGLDPFIVLALGTLSFAGIGWLAGPFVGNVFFAAFARRRGVWKEFIAVCDDWIFLKLLNVHSSFLHARRLMNGVIVYRKIEHFYIGSARVE